MIETIRLADLYRRMVDAGATPDMIAIMLEAYELGVCHADIGRQSADIGRRVGKRVH